MPQRVPPFEWSEDALRVRHRVLHAALIGAGALGLDLVRPKLLRRSAHDRAVGRELGVEGELANLGHQ